LKTVDNVPRQASASGDMGITTGDVKGSVTLDFTKITPKNRG
jgi:hypothetical protein